MLEWEEKRNQEAAERADRREQVGYKNNSKTLRLGLGKRVRVSRDIIRVTVSKGCRVSFPDDLVC